MCGIGGWIGDEAKQFQLSHLVSMMSAMRHRGPDDSSTWTSLEGNVALGHNRLSIIDLSTAGRQPMVNEANGDVLAFNGEIYNFHKLRADLEGKGFIFRSKSDTEVLLFALAAWGMEALSRVEGMYAFALWRPAENALYLARDAMGIKPLYTWSPDGRTRAFASEIKAFFNLPGFEARFDRRAIGQFLEFGYTFDADRTCLEGVSKLPPGHYMRIPLSRNEATRAIEFYTPPTADPATLSGGEAEEQLYETLKLVVEQHLIADVPVGLLLSGGLDSSLLAALAARTSKVRTLAMGFASSSLDERPHARRVAEHIGSDHEEVLIGPEEVKDGLADTIAVFDDLFADWGTISTRILYRKCRERGMKVVIVGEGSDELFGGYDIFKRGLSRLPTEMWLFQIYRNYAGRRYGQFYGDFRAVMLNYLAQTQGDRFAAIRLFESRRQLPNNYVMKVDKASMSVSVEARVPFLDRRIANIAYRSPASQLMAEGTEKILLRRVAERYGLLPMETLARRKVGGSIAANWMDDEPGWRSFAREIILDRSSWTCAMGLDKAMRAYFVDNQAGFAFPHAISNFRNLAWRLLILELWAQAYKVTSSAT